MRYAKSKMDSKILKKKQEAVNYFTKNLLKTEAGKDVARVILFGSVARGDVDAYSDVDLLLFTSVPEKVRPAVWEVGMDTYEKYGESVEPLLYSLKKYEDPDSYFLYRSIKTGKQLYPER